MALLEIDAIHIFYDKIEALKGASLRVETRQIVTLVGGNGAGKSTTLKAVIGLLRPRGGHIRFDGRPLGRAPAHRIAVMGLVQVPEGRRIFGKLSVRENLDMGGFTRTDRAGIAKDKDRMTALFPRLRKRWTQIAGTLSGSEQQMVEQVLETARLINRRKVTILVVEQNALRALGIADHGYVMESGRIILRGAGTALLDDERVQRAYLG